MTGAMQKKEAEFSRRDFIKILNSYGFLLTTSLPLFYWRPLDAQENPAEILAENPTAQQLKYVERAEESNVETRKPSQYCCTCQFFAEKQTLENGKCPKADARAKCQLIPVAPVRAGGYCSSWTAAKS